MSHDPSPPAPPAAWSSWRVLRSRGGPAGYQFALSEALLAVGLDATRRPALRWYLAREPALVLGNGQSPEAADLAACRTAGIRVYRRSSGGAAVLLDADAVNMEIALPAGHPLVGSDLARSYQWIGEIWVRALARLGVGGLRAIPLEEVRGLPPLARDDPLRLACYGTLSPFEVVAGHRKAVGFSQIRRRGGAIYQMSTYLHWRPEALAALLALTLEQRAALAERLGEVTIGLDALAGRDVTAEEVMTAVEGTLIERLGVRLHPGRWTAAERAAAARALRERFLPVA
jgi:lipoate-protein ligase A